MSRGEKGFFDEAQKKTGGDPHFRGKRTTLQKAKDRGTKLFGHDVPPLQEQCHNQRR